MRTPQVFKSRAAARTKLGCIVCSAFGSQRQPLRLPQACLRPLQPRRSGFACAPVFLQGPAAAMQHAQVPFRYGIAQADQLSQVKPEKRCARVALCCPACFPAFTYVALQALEIIPARLFMCAMRTADGMQRSNIALTSICYCIDTELVLGTAIPAALGSASSRAVCIIWFRCSRVAFLLADISNLPVCTGV